MSEDRTAGFQAIFDEAVDAAKKAAAAVGPENTQAFNCGFAWVVFKPATHPFVRWCKKFAKTDRAYGSPHWDGGWNFWSPARHPVQQVDHHYAGAKAFAGV